MGHGDWFLSPTFRLFTCEMISQGYSFAFLAGIFFGGALITLIAHAITDQIPQEYQFFEGASSRITL